MQYTNRNTVVEIDKILGEKKQVLDHGFVCVVDYMGCDSDIANAARVSYGQGTKTVNQDEGLIRYLMRHHHTTPFEMCEIKLHLKMPIFIARQWMRHRTANINEISARYSIIKDEFYVPELDRMAMQSAINNQGSGEKLSDDIAQKCQNIIQENCLNAFESYDDLINKKLLARELSRTILPQNTYTEFFWKIDLHNLLHFLRLRADSHAQKEIQQFAFAILDIVKIWVPVVYQAFMDYRVKSENMSAIDLEVIKSCLNIDKVKDYIEQNKDSKKGDIKELITKLEKFIR
ncbi:FAD-dependent thymidylate synthase [Candidatus Deianiraea vastatrix]|uniref:Flavin-dependent thymidylate synthase n=1 Tax=Candidatus Deianiraea vastatrix TaxID=2163644 RepID=A0A5B8XDA5_9RICK|nr:FAD-dependent thymidylate synthase [Candidatus Deianiraea vastatrix]QED23308.1 Thymidylate synthase ThyX [Candidatus Deianiraea vastatrix]